LRQSLPDFLWDYPKKEMFFQASIFRPGKVHSPQNDRNIRSNLSHAQRSSTGRYYLIALYSNTGGRLSGSGLTCKNENAADY